MEKKGVFVIIVLFALFLLPMVSAEEFGFNFLERLRTFLNLDDTPSTYSGASGECVAVNSAGNGLEFIPCSGGGAGSNFTPQQFQNAFNSNVSAGFVDYETTGTFKGLFNWTINSLSSIYLIFNGNELTFDEAKLNATINSQANITGDERYIRKDNGEVITAKDTIINFTFTNNSLGSFSDLAELKLKHVNPNGTMVFRVENDDNSSISLFAGGTNRFSHLGEVFINATGIGTDNADLRLVVTRPQDNIIMQVFNGTGFIDALIVQSDGIVKLQGTLFFEDENKSIFTDNVGSGNALVFKAAENLSGGETPFIFEAVNESGDLIFPLILQNGENQSGGFLRNSMIISGDLGVTNVTDLTNCFFMINRTGDPTRIDCNTAFTGADLFIEDDLQTGGIVFADEGIRAETLADFIMNGNNFDVANGSIHNFIPIRFESGFSAGQEVIYFEELFLGGLGSFQNLQGDLGNWFPTASILCAEGDCAEADGFSGNGNIIMEANFSSLNINNSRIQFIYSLINLKGSNSFSVEINNNEGSGFVTLFTDSTDDVVLSSQDIALPTSMDNRSNLGLRFICDVTNQNRECFVDTIKINGTAQIDTNITVPGFNSEFCAGDGTRGADGNCSRGLLYSAADDLWIFNGPVNFTGVAGSGISGSGTATNIMKWASTTSATNSIMVDNSTDIINSGGFFADKFYGLFNWLINLEDSSSAYLTFNGSTLSFNETKLNATILNLSGGGGGAGGLWESNGTSIFNITVSQVGIRTATPSHTLSVNGTINFTDSVNEIALYSENTYLVVEG